MAAVYFSPIKNRQQDLLPLILDHPFGEDERAVSIPVSDQPLMDADHNGIDDRAREDDHGFLCL